MRRIFHVRFGDIERHRPLIRLAQGPKALLQETWAPILLWHLCLRELLLSDFLETWLYPRKQEGLLRVRADDVRAYLAELKPRGLLDKDWKPSSVSRMASGLPAYAADFGLLQGKAVKEIAPFHLPDEALLYVLHDLAAETASADEDPRTTSAGAAFSSRAPSSSRSCSACTSTASSPSRWRAAWSSLELPHKSVDEYVEHLVG